MRGLLISICALLFAVSASAQAHQAAQKEQEKKPAAATNSFGPTFDQAAVERGQKIFVPTCGFCHGPDARGKSGPDLVRSAVVLHDNNGDLIGPVVRNGRPDRGMPAFASLTPEQMSDLATFLHSRTAAASNRFSYKVSGLLTGNAQAGEAFFNGEGKCNTCHSPTGDLAHIATKYDPPDLQRRFLYPVPSLMDMFMGKKVKPPLPTKVTVSLPSGETVTGTLEHMDEFIVALRDSSGWYRSFSRENAKVEVQDPRAAHEAMLPNYTDQEMHDMLAYLETLK